ncbi:hypothetical protein L5I01_32455 [Gordonia sp. HY442]|nr:hypothetical protein [Gordonia zhenghanii]
MGNWFMNAEGVPDIEANAPNPQYPENAGVPPHDYGVPTNTLTLAETPGTWQYNKQNGLPYGTESTDPATGTGYREFGDGNGNVSVANGTPVPDSGGSQDFTIDNPDGTTTHTREVPDGDGGTTVWSQNPDGSNTVRYPDGSIYEEPGTSGKGYTEALPTTQPDGSTGLDTTYRSPDDNTYTANTQWNDNNTISTTGTTRLFPDEGVGRSGASVRR